MRREKTTLQKWVVLLLVFVFSCTCELVLAPQKAEAIGEKERVKTVTGSVQRLILYSDGTVKAEQAHSYCEYSYGGKYGLGNNHGELNVNGATNAIDIAAGGCASLVLHRDGTVSGSGHFSGGVYPSKYYWAFGFTCGYDYNFKAGRNRDKYYAIHANDYRHFVAPSPNADIVAISLHEIGYAVLYKDGTYKVDGYFGQLSGKYPNAQAIRLGGGTYVWREYITGHHKYSQSFAVQIVKEDGNIETIGIEGIPIASGHWSDWGYRLENPIVELSDLPEGLKIYKSENNLTFKVKVNDPSYQPAESIPTEIQLDLGNGFRRVENFTANGTTISNGKLSAKNGTVYTIKINKNAVIPHEINSFRLRVVASRDFYRLSDEKIVTLRHVKLAPHVEFISLPPDLRLHKSEDTLAFKVKVSMPKPEVKNLITEFYVGYLDYDFEKVNNFKVNGVPVANGQFTAVNGGEYAITIDNKGAYVPITVNKFKLKGVATDPAGVIGENEVDLIHYSDIIAKWSFDFIEGRTAFDTSGNHNHGIIQGTTLTTGIINNAFEFDGVNSYVGIPRVSFNNLTDWAFEAWVKPEGPGYIYSEGNPWVTMSIEMKNDNSITVGTWHHERTGNWNWFNSGADALIRNAWNHLVVTLTKGGPTKDSGIINCYVNGALVKSGKLGKEYHLATKEAILGGNVSVKVGQGLSPFKGCLDEVALYSRALTAEEVKRNYQNAVYLENMKITNQNNEETSAPCTFGVHMNKLEFDLMKTVNELVLKLDLPSNIKVASVGNLFKEGAPVEKYVVTADNNKIVFTQPLTAGHYKLEFILGIDDQLIVKTEYYHDEKKSKINHESEKFEFKFLDFGSLPNIK